MARGRRLKNYRQLKLLFALSKLWMVRHQLRAAKGKRVQSQP